MSRHREELTAKRAELQDALNRIGQTNGDPAVARLGPTALRQHHRRMDSDITKAVALMARIRDLDFAIAKAEHEEAEAARVRLTAADLQGAAYVRDSSGWAKVVRVSGKSVTVETAYSWTERIPLEKVLEAGQGW